MGAQKDGKAVTSHRTATAVKPDEATFRGMVGWLAGWAEGVKSGDKSPHCHGRKTGRGDMGVNGWMARRVRNRREKR